MHHASEGQVSICVESVYGFLNGRPNLSPPQLKTILVAKWEVPVLKPERLPKRGVRVALVPGHTAIRYFI